MHLGKFLGVRGTGPEEGQDPQRAGARHSLAVTKGSRRGGSSGSHPARTPRLGPLGWAGRGASPCLPGAVKGGCCCVLRDTEREREEHPDLGHTSVVPNARGAVRGEGAPGPHRPAFSLCLLPPPCSRDLKRDVAKKLEKLEKRTQRAIAELIRKCGAWHGGAPCPLGGGAGAWPRSTPPVCPHAGERLKGQEENLASAVATTAATEPEACDSD